MQTSSLPIEVDRYGFNPIFYKQLDKSYEEIMSENKTTLSSKEEKKLVHFLNYMFIRLSTLKDNPRITANVFQLTLKDNTTIKFTLSELRQVFYTTSEFSMKSLPLRTIYETESNRTLRKILKFHPFKRLLLESVE